ncbi:hypothetical protein ABT093_22590 [Kitasatospora sp. NPDC002551]|uniref:hypothetical protein n=1 Tax=Kitasatospora sp. NPDC002551 TaxID=3154539 RepID=UPI003323D59F
MGATVLTLASCENGVDSSGSTARDVPSASPASVDSIMGIPSRELREQYGVTVPVDAIDPSYGRRKEGGGGELWVKFGIGKGDLNGLLASMGTDEEKLHSGLIAFTSTDLELTGWSLDPAHSVKGVLVPTKDGGMKSPSQKITIDYSDSNTVTVYILAMKP